MDRILVLGAAGRFGVALTQGLKERYGAAVITADLTGIADIKVDVLDKHALHALVIRERITDIYHLAATLTASGEQYPLTAWELNVKGLLNVLDIAKTESLKIFWPSSIAVFGPTAPKSACSQTASTEPATAYGISKVAGELWCKYYHEQYGVDVRSIRYPGLISPVAIARGGTSDYTIDIFHQAIRAGQYTSYLKPHTIFPTMYMPDAVRSAIALMGADRDRITVRTAYNIAALSFSPLELAAEMQNQGLKFGISYCPDHRQQIADSWPQTLDDRDARHDWNWEPAFDLPRVVADMLLNIKY